MCPHAALTALQDHHPARTVRLLCVNSKPRCSRLLVSAAMSGLGCASSLGGRWKKRLVVVWNLVGSAMRLLPILWAVKEHECHFDAQGIALQLQPTIRNTCHVSNILTCACWPL